MHFKKLFHIICKTLKNVSLYANSASNRSTSGSQIQQHKASYPQTGYIFEIIKGCAAQTSGATFSGSSVTWLCGAKCVLLTTYTKTTAHRHCCILCIVSVMFLATGKQSRSDGRFFVCRKNKRNVGTLRSLKRRYGCLEKFLHHQDKDSKVKGSFP